MCLKSIRNGAGRLQEGKSVMDIEIKRDYRTPVIDRMKRQSMKWYKENREKALAYGNERHKKRKLQINPKWGLCYGGW
jgi:hypothetical protein